MPFIWRQNPSLKLQGHIRSIPRPLLRLHLHLSLLAISDLLSSYPGFFSVPAILLTLSCYKVLHMFLLLRMLFSLLFTWVTHPYFSDLNRSDITNWFKTLLWNHLNHICLLHRRIFQLQFNFVIAWLLSDVSTRAPWSLVEKGSSTHISGYWLNEWIHECTTDSMRNEYKCHMLDLLTSCIEFIWISSPKL